MLTDATHSVAQDRQPDRRFTNGVLIRFAGPISPLLERSFFRKLNSAQRQEADLVIVEIDSPGGFLGASLNIADRLRKLDWAHTVAFIPREALSGAAIVALACDEIVMDPDARFGDAGPIFQGKDALFRHAPEKIRSDLARRVRDLATDGGRPPALAEAMVDMDLVVYRVRNKQTGEESFLSEQELESVDNPDDWELGKPVLESREDHFLTVNGQRAVELRLAEANVQTREELVERFGLPDELIVLEPTGVDTAVTILNLPIVTGVLFVIGLIALYLEFSAPGIGMGGLVAGLCFAIFFWSRFLGGTAGWLEVILFGAGLAFLAVELFVIPGFGIAGFSGLTLIVISIVMASQHFLIPSTARQLSMSMNSIIVLATSGLVFLIAAVALSRYFKVMPVVSWLVLEAPSATAPEEKLTPEGKSHPPAGSSHGFPVDVGDWGVADSPLRPAGKVRFGEEYVDVVTDGSFVDQGHQVRVIEISGNRVVVREVPPQA
jgi:membrane-bound serine protease (ClpP class)